MCVWVGDGVGMQGADEGCHRSKFYWLAVKAVQSIKGCAAVDDCA